MWSWTKLKNRAELLKYAKEFDIVGVELTMATKEELFRFKLTKSQANWLRSLDYVSIHAPFRLLRRAENHAELLKQLDCIQEVYKKVNAKAVIIHPPDLPGREVLDSYDMHFITENLPKDKHITIRKLEKIFREYPKLGLCLDVAHAYLWSKDETGKLVKKFRKRIKQIHFSGTYKKNDHVPLQSVSSIFLKSIEPVKKLDVPVVIEEDIKIKDLGFVKKEIAYIKSLF